VNNFGEFMSGFSLPHSFTHQQRTSFHFQVYQLYFPSTVSNIFIHYFSSVPVSGIKIHASRLVSAAGFPSLSTFNASLPINNSHRLHLSLFDLYLTTTTNTAINTSTHQHITTSLVYRAWPWFLVLKYTSHYLK
jgi:hypothetical protein